MSTAPKNACCPHCGEHIVRAGRDTDELYIKTRFIRINKQTQHVTLGCANCDAELRIAEDARLLRFRRTHDSD